MGPAMKARTDKVHTAMLELMDVNRATGLLTFMEVDGSNVYTVNVVDKMAEFAQELIVMPKGKDQLLMCEFSLEPAKLKGAAKNAPCTSKFNIKRLHAFTHSNSERSYRIRNV